MRLGLRLVRGLGSRAREKLQAARAEGPFRSVDDVVRRSGLGARELRVLAEAGAFETLWPGRREALWEVLRRVRGDAGPLARRSDGAAAARRSLPPMNPIEMIAADYRCTGLSITGHPVAHLRPELNRRGAITAEALRSCRRDDRVHAAGLVICRQRPGPAKGIMFVTLEDETGFSNFVVMPDRVEKMRDVLRAPLLLLGGVVQEEDGVINVLVDQAEALDLGGHTLRVSSHDYR
jgi:error-prone DNA polymerase